MFLINPKKQRNLNSNYCSLFKMKDKSDKKKKIMVYFMGFIMISSIFGVIFFGFSSGGSTSSIKYGTYKFTRSGNIWTTKLSGLDAVFSFLPMDVEFMDVEQEAINMLKGRIQLDVTADLNDTLIQSIALAHFQMKSSLGIFNIFLRDGFTTNNEFNLPVIKCQDSNPNVPVIYFKEGNFTRIYSDEDCVIVESNNGVDFIRAKDRIVYGILDIIK